MTRKLFSVGEISYNGFTFPQALNSKIRAVPVYDTADRARKYVQYTITIECIVVGDDLPTAVAGDPTDDNLEDIRKRLTAPNKALTFTDQGFGTLSVDGTTVIDSRYGPKPRLLAWEPVGSNRACRIAWTVEVTIPECSDGTPLYTNAFAEFTYDTAWNINEAGMTTRTIHATLEIPVDTNGQQILDNADRLRDFIDPPVPLGFWRDRHYHESRDKRVLEVSIVDTEIPSDNPYFPGSIRCDVRHRVESDFENRGFVWWNSTLEGTIEVAPGGSRGELYQAFLAVVAARREKALNRQVNMRDIKPPRWAKGYPVLIRLSVEESLFSREISFSATWWVFADITEMVAATGLFTPVGTNWNTWKTSLTGITGNRGVAGMRSNASDDVIVDLCNVNYPQPNSDLNKTLYPASNSLFTNSCTHVTPENSWLTYKPRFNVDYNFNTAYHATLAEKPEAHIVSGSSQPSPGEVGLRMDEVTQDMQSSSQEEHSIQIRGPVRPTLVFSGMAERICNSIPLPKLVSIGGKTASLKSSWFSPYIKTTSSTMTIYGLVWRQEYYLDSVPVGDFNATIETQAIPSSYSGANSK